MHTIPQTVEKVVATQACKDSDMPYSTGEQLHFLPSVLRVWGVKSKTPFAFMVLSAGALHYKSSINPLCTSKHSYTTHDMALFSSSHLPDSNNWGTNTSLFRYFYKYKYISIRMHIHKVMVAQWRSLPALMFCCSSSELLADLSLCYWNCCGTVSNTDQPPQFMLSRSPKALWDLLSSQSGTSSWIHWCILVIGVFA